MGVNASFQVPDVSCAHCKSTIESALRPLAGVERAEVDVDAKLVSVEFDPAVIDEAAVVHALAGAGYAVAR